MKRYAKLLAALVGTVTPAAVIAAAAHFGLEVSTEVAVAVVAVLGAVATALGPANAAPVALVDQAPYDGECDDCPASDCADCPLR